MYSECCRQCNGRVKRRLCYETELLDEHEGLIIAIEENFEEVLQDWIDENLDEDDEE